MLQDQPQFHLQFLCCLFLISLQPKGQRLIYADPGDQPKMWLILDPFVREIESDPTIGWALQEFGGSN